MTASTRAIVWADLGSFSLDPRQRRFGIRPVRARHVLRDRGVAMGTEERAWRAARVCGACFLRHSDALILVVIVVIRRRSINGEDRSGMLLSARERISQIAASRERVLRMLVTYIGQNARLTSC
jgi:hypothetical protein